MPILFIIGLVTLAGFYTGKLSRVIKMPSVIGFLLAGAFLGPFALNLISTKVQTDLSLIPELALGFVALSIGLELNFQTLKKQGKSVLIIILFESLVTFIMVTLGMLFVGMLIRLPQTVVLPLALLTGSISAATAPAGTVSVIQENNARGELTRTLYSVVGFDDGIGIILFGFCSAISKSLLKGTGGDILSIMQMFLSPLAEIGLSLAFGIGIGFLVSLLLKRLSNNRDILVLTVITVFLVTGICDWFHLSFILTNMIMGITIVNTQTSKNVHTLNGALSDVMPFLFILFFVLAGSNLNFGALPALGVLGTVYILFRGSGKLLGAWLGSLAGGADKIVKKYVGLGILSQVGVAVGLSLIVKKEFSEINPDGHYIGATIITFVTATCLFFDVIGPILTKHALVKAGEITNSKSNKN